MGVAVLVGAYFPREDWAYKGSRPHLDWWLKHFKQQTPGDYRVIISDSGSHPDVQKCIRGLAGENVEVFTDGVLGEMLNFKYMLSKLRNEDYVLYIGNDMIIRNIDNEDWIAKGIDILSRYSCLAYSIIGGKQVGDGAWDLREMVEPDVYRMSPFSTQIMLMRRADVDRIDWDWMIKMVNKQGNGHWEAILNLWFSQNSRHDINHLCYNHDRLGCVTIQNYTEDKMNEYVTSTKFFPHTI